MSITCEVLFFSSFSILKGEQAKVEEKKASNLPVIEKAMELENVSMCGGASIFRGTIERGGGNGGK